VNETLGTNGQPLLCRPKRRCVSDASFHVPNPSAVATFYIMPVL